MDLNLDGEVGVVCSSDTTFLIENTIFNQSFGRMSQPFTKTKDRDF